MPRLPLQSSIRTRATCTLHPPLPPQLLSRFELLLSLDAPIIAPVMVFVKVEAVCVPLHIQAVIVQLLLHHLVPTIAQNTVVASKELVFVNQIGATWIVQSAP